MGWAIPLGKTIASLGVLADYHVSSWTDSPLIREKVGNQPQGKDKKGNIKTADRNYCRRPFAFGVGSLGMSLSFCQHVW